MLQLIKVIDEWVKVLDKGGQLDVIYTDFEKAFDKVPHKRLISKLYSYGLNSSVINWIQNFLSGRQQVVKINNAFSSKKPVTSGIPQGSVLGPLLFVIYINDLPDIFKDLCTNFLFADDAKMYKQITTYDDARVLNHCFNKLNNWSEHWLMKLNINKCFYMTIAGKSDNNIDFNYFIDFNDNVNNISRVCTSKDLGVLIDKDLSFQDHISDKIKVARKMLGIINRSFKNINKRCFLILYKSFVRSHLEYGSCLFNPYKIGLIKNIESVQRHATRIVCGTNKMSYIERLKYLKHPTLKYRRYRGDMIEVYKIINGIYDQSVIPHLSRNINSRARGNSCKLQVFYSRLDICKYSFCNRVVCIWNSLPDYVVSSTSVNNFKNNLDKAWFNEPFLFDYEAPVPGIIIA